MENLSTKKIISKKIKADKTASILSSTLAWLFSLLFLCLIIFIIIGSIPGFQEYGIVNILFTGQFDLSSGEASIWLPLFITILTSTIAILIGGPLGVKTAIFIKYRLPNRYKKTFRIAIEVLADIPSVIFGLFAAQSLGIIVKLIFGLDTAYNLLTASLMLAFMILPTVVSLSLNALDGVDNSLLSAAMVLGNTKTRAIYKVCKKEASAGITVAILIALTRAIGETMAVSMILQGQGYNATFDNGFISIITSGLRSLGALISANMFAESGSPALQGLLYAFGIFLFIFVMILNAIAMRMTNKKNKSSWWGKTEIKIHYFVTFIPNQIAILYEKITYHSKIKRSSRDLSQYYSTRIKNNKFINVYTYWKCFWEWFTFICTIGFLIWICLNIFWYGILALTSGDSTVFSLAKDSTGQALINTLLIIVIAMLIGLPLSLMIAIYLNEFAKESKSKKFILFFIDSLGATPSILFGMFGLSFFIQTLGMSSGGTAGKSLIAGALTVLIVILPTFIRTIQQALSAVPNELRTNSYALGAGKWETIVKIVFPIALQGIITSIVLSIGRILAETAPLYLTSGLSSSNNISLDGPGQTLTTRIYAQIYNQDAIQGTNIMYECAIVTMILVFVIIMVVHIGIPYYYKWKSERIKKKNYILLEKNKVTRKTKQNKIISKQNELQVKKLISNKKTDDYLKKKSTLKRE